MIIGEDEIPKPVDISLVTGSPIRLPRATRFNKLRELLMSKDSECWLCHKLNSCQSVDKIFSCQKVKHITKNLNKEDYYEKA